MRIAIFLIFSFILFSPLIGQEKVTDKKFIFGSNGGIGASYADKAFLLNLQASLTLDYIVTNNWSIQFAPEYTWLIKWNEHYLTLPIHLRKKIGEKISFFVGPTITFDVGYFRDFGISGGVYYHLNNKSALVLSIFTFTLYDYNIDYLFVPIGISYNYMFLK